jgi:hypothetical protein
VVGGGLEVVVGFGGGDPEGEGLSASGRERKVRSGWGSNGWIENDRLTALNSSTV